MRKFGLRVSGGLSLLSFLALNGPASAAVTVKPIGSRTMLRTTENPAQKLESLVVDVNGERRRIEPGSGLTVVSGDLVTVVEAWLVDKSRPIALVDVVGFRSRGRANTQDERGIVIDSGRDFEPRQSEGGRGVEYFIRASGSGVLYGEARLKIESPKLISFEVEVNGKRQTLTDGDKIHLSPQDGIKVLSIQTNIRGNENVRYDLRESRDASGRLVKELRFKRGEAIFAKIPVEWLGS